MSQYLEIMLDKVKIMNGLFDCQLSIRVVLFYYLSIRKDYVNQNIKSIERDIYYILSNNIEQRVF